ncbi:N-formylglutamate amidohydrolase [Parasulfitobacter algicola]|uniref:N-formylglutamate amidohydrolase n=1 Tax=Parasulfitobacter algicola TaxID=2614809 RepID=A0ABX2IXF1_9RHOB|nr:N-formylglutamate amidohydrolase [Sulfitobacter algicola]NSX54988.1 N-formylglutamate amidohydrolase [Sulfitobacter algicola]
MSNAAYSLDLPQKRTTSVVFASPHSGRDYSDVFLNQTVLDKKTIRSSEDAFVDKLFVAAPRFGAPLLRAGAPRAFVDLNRSADELDPALIEGVGKVSHNPRVASGLGVIPRVVANGRAIYRGKMSWQRAQDRITHIWHPYHARLQQLLTENHNQFGEAILIDCHSMPHEAIESIAKSAVKKPQIVLGDRFGAAANSDVMDRVEQAFTKVGLNVVRNTPFAGAYIAQTYGRPSRRQHVIQIEIDRALYMDEKTILPRRDFETFRKLITGAIADITQIGQVKLPMAAE